MKQIPIILSLILGLALNACSINGGNIPNNVAQPTTVSLNGQWDFLPSDKTFDELSKVDWKKINVPANWYREGYDISGKAYYRKSFFVGEKLENKHIQLIFNGVDYITEVWINGKYLGKREGYFQRFDFDITPYLKFNADNALIVRVDSPLEADEDFSLNKRWIKGIFSHHDTRPGGAWSEQGQERNTGGIWNDVELHISDHTYIRHIEMSPEKLDEQQWRFNATIKTDGEYPKTAKFHWTLTPKNHSAKLISGVSQFPQISFKVDNPALWWPVGFGEPNLYEFNVRLMEDGKVLEQSSMTTAFRTVELDADKAWIINGKRILLLGTNYIPTQWLAEMDRDDFARDVALMKAANINAVRVHAHITSPAFYELCDEQGLMVWQDFPLQWGYQDSAMMHRQAMLQVRDMIKQLGHHPSIIHWTLHNEPPWDADWMKWKYDNYHPTQNKVLDQKLYSIATHLEKSRPVSMYSATAEHPWFGWYSGHWLDYAKPTDQAFIAEFGSQALPDKHILKRILGDVTMPPHSDEEKKQQWKHWETWKYHNFQPRETFEIANIDAGNHTDALIENTQQYQVRLNQLAAESYRRQAYQPVTALFQFMFVEDWESMNWGIVDYWRHTKPGYDSLKQAYQAVLPSLEWSAVEYPLGSVSIGLWKLNDSPKSYSNVRYQIKLLKQGKTIDQQAFNTNLLADAHEKIQTYTTPTLDAGEYRLEATILDQNEQVLGSNHYVFTVKATKEDKGGQ